MPKFLHKNSALMYSHINYATTHEMYPAQR